MVLNLLETEDLTIENIYKKVSQEELWRRYLGFLPKFGKAFNSPIRVDENASCTLLKTRTGDVIMKDHKGKLYNIVQFIMAKQGLSWYQSLLLINHDFKFEMLLSLTNNSNYSSIERKPIEFPEYAKTVIGVKVRPWTNRDADYWNRYCITESLLKEYDVWPLSDYWIGKEGGSKLTHILCHHLTYVINFGDGLRKIYCPSKGKIGKWISNANKDIIMGIDNLPLNGRILILTKSMKDILVWKVLGYDAIAPQSETTTLGYNVFKPLFDRFGKIVINYDADETGNEITKKILTDWKDNPDFNFDTFQTSREYKDISDHIEKFGYEDTKELVNLHIT